MYVLGINSQQSHIFDKAKYFISECTITDHFNQSIKPMMIDDAICDAVLISLSMHQLFYFALIFSFSNSYKITVVLTILAFFTFPKMSKFENV